MQTKTLSVIALSNRGFASFEAKMREAVQWLEVAAARGTDLAVLPENLNCYEEDGWNRPRARTMEELALDDWQTATSLLIETAVRLRMAVTIPVLIREGDHLANVFFLIAKDGTVLGRYQKMQPTQGELDHGVQPGRPTVIAWEGVQVGGAICFDTNFRRIFEAQVALGAQLFLAPSLWPGGDVLRYYALHYSTPIALAYPAWSRIIDIDGRECVEGGYRHETLRFGFGIPVYTATLNFDRVRLHADGNQQKMLEVQQAYGGRVGIRFDQPNCSFYLESLADDLTVGEVCRAFDLLPARDYLARFPMSE